MYDKMHYINDLEVKFIEKSALLVQFQSGLYSRVGWNGAKVHIL